LIDEEDEVPNEICFGTNASASTRGGTGTGTGTGTDRDRRDKATRQRWKLELKQGGRTEGVLLCGGCSVLCMYLKEASEHASKQVT
jgi:hypothetical protein